MQKSEIQVDENIHLDLSAFANQDIAEIFHSKDEKLKPPHPVSGSIEQLNEHAPRICAAPICFLRRSRKNIAQSQFEPTDLCNGCAADENELPRAKGRHTPLSKTNRQSYNRLVGLETAAEIPEVLSSDVSELVDDQLAFLLLTDPGFVELDAKQT